MQNHTGEALPKNLHRTNQPETPAETWKCSFPIVLSPREEPAVVEIIPSFCWCLEPARQVKHLQTPEEKYIEYGGAKYV